MEQTILEISNVNIKFTSIELEVYSHILDAPLIIRIIKIVLCVQKFTAILYCDLPNYIANQFLGSCSTDLLGTLSITDLITK